MSINEIQDQIIEEFSIFDDWLDKYEYLIELSKDMPTIEDKHKTDDRLIEGCQSRLWLHAHTDDKKIHFSADSDAIITKGIAYLLIRVFNEQTADDILEADLYFIDKIGLRQNLSPTRANGLLSMLKQMKMYALAFKSQAG